MDEVETRRRPPPVPPLWEGIYTFVGRPENIVPWIILTVYLTILACIGAAFHQLFRFIFSFDEGAVMFGLGQITFAFLRPIYTGLLVLGVFFSLHSSLYFARVVEDTAAGQDEVTWPKEPWLDMVGKSFSLAWLLVCSAIAAISLSQVLLLAFRPGYLTWVYAVVTLIWMIFPIFLLSTMAGGSPWKLLEPNIMVGLCTRPAVTGFLLLNSFLIYVPCAVLGFAMIGYFHLWLTPFVGLAWSIGLLSYARVIGRAGYALTADEKRKVRKKKKRRIRREDEDDED